jgi:hypothetical protein
MTENEREQMLLKLKKESQKRIASRVFYGIIVGICCAIWGNWYWIFGAIAFYSFGEASKLYEMAKSNKLLDFELGEDIKPENEDQAKGYVSGYALSQAGLQFLFTFLTILFFASLSKFITWYFL